MLFKRLPKEPLDTCVKHLLREVLEQSNTF